MIVRNFKYILLIGVGLMLCSCITSHDEKYENFIKSDQETKDLSEQELAHKIRVFFSYADSLAAHATSGPVGKYKNKALSVEEAGLDTTLEWISFTGMTATTSADNSMAMLTLPTRIDDDLKKAICTVASKKVNDSRVQKKSYYFTDCPADL